MAGAEALEGKGLPGVCCEFQLWWWHFQAHAMCQVALLTGIILAFHTDRESRSARNCAQCTLLATVISLK